MNVSRWCSRIIRWMFYLLFILVPLILTPWNYELFEYNKMMVTYAITVIILGAWITKMIQDRQIRITKTPLDVPIALFGISQLVSTVFSMDPHVSWFGYYSRFNGGMLSVLSYITLYYAFVSVVGHEKENSQIQETKKNKKPAVALIESQPFIHTLMPFLRAMTVSAFVVALYGIAERLGIDKNLWVQDVQNRVFSTLGQPNWLAAYLVALIPVSIIGTLIHPPVTKNGKLVPFVQLLKYLWWSGCTFIFFVVLLFTRSRSGLFAFAVSDVLLWLFVFASLRKNKQLIPTTVIFHAVIAIIIFFNGSNVAQIDKYFSLGGIKNAIANRKTATITPASQTGYSAPVLETGGTESGIIRRYVWQGAIGAWKSSTKAMALGTGTETFAFAFYRFRPASHNLTSEWDFLYNKAHNEYLNYLATTGAFGLASYILMLGTFIVWFTQTYLSKLKAKNADTTHTPPSHTDFVCVGLFVGWISILVTNFFGFSVVIMQVFLFLFPALILVAHNTQSESQSYIRKLKTTLSVNVLIGTVLASVVVLLTLTFSAWYADTAYASSYRMARSGQFAQAKLTIEQAVLLNPGEPVYHDEMATTLAALATGALEQKNATVAAELAKRALAESDRAIATSPKNVNFWKTRTKLYYSFSAFDPKYNDAAIGALEKAGELSPNDAKIYYNLAILYGRAGQNDKSIEFLKKSILLKPNYHDSYYALYVFYLEIKKPDLARAILEEYLQKIDPTDQNFTEILGKTK